MAAPTQAPAQALLEQFIAMGFKPSITQRELLMELDEESLKKLLLKGIDPRYQSFIDLVIESKKIVIKIRLM